MVFYCDLRTFEVRRLKIELIHRFLADVSLDAFQKKVGAELDFALMVRCWGHSKRCLMIIVI